MKVRVVIQARMGSSRLRGKTLSPIKGIPLLKRVVDTVYGLELADDILVATTDQIEDDPIYSYCTFLNIKCLRGDVNNVLSRFYAATDGMKAEDTIVRITADNLFYQKKSCQNLIKIHIQNKNDYTGIDGLSHIVGEFIKVGVLQKIVNEQLSDYDKEHVTPYIINNSERFKASFINPKEIGLKRELDKLLTIDTEEDRNRIEKIIEYFENKNINFTKENLYNWLEHKNK